MVNLKGPSAVAVSSTDPQKGDEEKSPMTTCQESSNSNGPGQNFGYHRRAILSFKSLREYILVKTQISPAGLVEFQFWTA